MEYCTFCKSDTHIEERDSLDDDIILFVCGECGHIEMFDAMIYDHQVVKEIQEKEKERNDDLDFMFKKWMEEE